MSMMAMKEIHIMAKRLSGLIMGNPMMERFFWALCSRVAFISFCVAASSILLKADLGSSMCRPSMPVMPLAWKKLHPATDLALQLGERKPS